MTDGRIPGKWINEPRFAEMDVDTWCVLTKAIAWSNEAGTDGHIKRRYLGIFHPDGHSPKAYENLVAMEIWEIVPDGYQFINWAKKPHQGGLGQSTAEQVQKNREASKATSKAYRDRKKNESRDSVTPTGHVGQDRTGHDRPYTGEDFNNENIDSQTGEILDSPQPIMSWPVTKIPTDPGYCAHGTTVGMKCRQCPGGTAMGQAA